MSLTLLRKLRGRSVAELRERGEQRIATWMERAGFRDAGERELSRILPRLKPNAASAGVEALLDSVLFRVRPPFFGVFGAPEDTRHLLRTRWPQHVQSVVESADRVMQGEFRLLGYPPVRFEGPVDWHRDPAANVRAPLLHWSRLAFLDPTVAGDHKLVWELNRHQFAVTLGQAYFLTGRESYAERASDLFDSWMDANPPKQGVNWASSLEVAYRSIAWLWALRFLRLAVGLRRSTVARMLAHLEVNGRHLERYLSTYFSPNTHLTGEALGLLYLGTQLPEFRGAAQWRDTGWRILHEQLPRHVRDDGTYFEQSTYYHRYTLDIYLHARMQGELHGLRNAQAFDEPLRRLAEFFVWIQRGDGSIPLFGDEDGGRLLFLDDSPGDDVRPALALAAAITGSATAALGGVGGEAEVAYYLGPAGITQLDAIVPAPPTALSRPFPQGGFYTLRDGWGSDAGVLTIDCGQLGAANGGHAHADTLAIDLAVGLHQTFVDAGTISYSTSIDERRHLRESMVHNTVSLDEASSSKPAGPFSWHTMTDGALERFIVTAEGTYFRGSHRGYSRSVDPVRHRRELLSSGEGWWMMRDTIDATAEHGASAAFQCAAGLRAVQTSDDTIDLLNGDRPVLRVTSCGSGVWTIGEGYASRRYGARTRGVRLSFHFRVDQRRDALFLLRRADRDVDMEYGRAGATTWMRLRTSQWLDTALWGGVGWSYVDSIHTDAALAWVRQPNAESSSASLLVVDGSFAELGSERLTVPGTASWRAARTTASEWHLDLFTPLSSR